MSTKSTTHLKIDNGGYSQYDNSLHAQFHRTQYDYVAAVNIAKLNMPAEVLGEWKKNIDAEVEINKETEASIHTAKLLAKDRERDKLLTYLFGEIKNNKIAPDDLKQQAAEKLDVIIKPYYGIQKDPMESESLHIVGMRADLEKYPGEVAALNLMPVVAKLYTVNDEFEKLRKERREETGIITPLNSREIRLKTDESFSKVCIYILSANLHATTDEDRELISTLITNMNKTSHAFRANNNEIIAQRKAAAKKKKEKEGGGGEDDKKKPSDPKKPDDGKTPKPGREEDPGEDKA
ncbi:MAG: hypothetical protein HXN43_01515 [Prevotella micans]|nr:hypothetical protein [Prevotella micans]